VLRGAALRWRIGAALRWGIGAALAPGWATSWRDWYSPRDEGPLLARLALAA
jgi:hypothetical protein